MIRLLRRRHIGLLALTGLLTGLPLLVQPGPAAHGPGGEHPDTARAGLAAAASTSPRFESATDLFEMVGALTGTRLSLFLDRFATNEPVADATIEVESGGVKAPARFQAETGDYSIEDRAMLARLSVPGEHPLVISVLAGKENDLLDAILRVPPTAAAHGHDHDHGFHAEEWALIALGTGALLTVGVGVARSRSRRRQAGKETRS